MYVNNNQPNLGFWSELVKTVTDQVKKRKTAIVDRERRRAAESAARQTKTGAPLTAGFGSVSPWLLAGAAGVGLYMLISISRRRRRR